MFMEERQREIAEIIAAQGKITVGEIAERFGISEESARRDLRLLEQKKLCQRTHGGAIAPRPVGMTPPVDRDFRQMPVFDNYREIAKAALAQIRPGDVVFLTGGSFGHIMATLLPRDFAGTLVVNNVELAAELRSLTKATVYAVGGKMRQSGSVTDSLATEFVSRMHFDLCFLTGAGLTAEFGLSNGTDETAAFQRAVLGNSRKKYLLIPGVKIGADGFIRVCGAACFDRIITDWDCAEEQLAALEEMGIPVTAVEESQ